MTSEILLGEEHALLRLDGAADQTLAYEDEPKWQACGAALRHSTNLTVIVPSSATLKLALPMVPRGERELREMLALLAPLELHELLWTVPAEAGTGTSVTLVRRDWLDHRIAAFRHHVIQDRYLVVDAERVPFVRNGPRADYPRWVIGSTAAAAIGLAATAWSWQSSRSHDRAPVAAAAASSQPSPTAIKSPSAPVSAQGPSAPAARASSGLVLLGIAGRLPDNADAMIKTPWGKTSTMRIGDSLLGWKLISIAPDRILLEKDGLRDELVLEPIP